MGQEEYNKKIIRQNEIIISLLGRMVFSPKEIKDIVTQGKRLANRENYIQGYNACDGNHSVSDLAKIIKIDSGGLSTILQSWEETGIIYEVDKPNGKFYKKIMII
ncbi:hypothetical protein KQH27_00830 [bacterium]|nr:hypothetical protein [bacterium]